MVASLLIMLYIVKLPTYSGMFCCRQYTVADVVSILEEDDFLSADIFVLPPEDATKSDEDSGPEDDDGHIDNLSGNQLRAEAEATVTVSGFHKDRIAANDPEDESDLETFSNDGDIQLAEASGRKVGRGSRETTGTTEAHSSNAKRRRRSTVVGSSTAIPPQPKGQKKTAPPVRQWVKCDMKQPDIPWNIISTTGSDRTPSSLFELFYDDTVIDHITKMTNLYAMQNSKQIAATPSEIRLVIAILLISGYVPLVNRRMYWDSSEDVHNAAVSSAMTVNRFEELLRYMHVCDNTDLDANDKLAKLRPLFVMLNERFVQHWPVEQDISIDESMVPYYGRHSSKQFIRGKPIRFGFKVWCLNNRLGYLIQCEPYQGSSGSFNADIGLGGSVVSQLVEKIPDGNSYRLYVDNFFTSPRLLDHLKAMKISVTGTVRANRMEKCPLVEADKLKKDLRGSFDHRLDRNSGMLAVRWNDNSVVTVLSNCFGIEPMTQVKRWSAAEKKHVQIPMPNMIAQYNRFMGGTDRMDQNIAKFRINIRIKKWWWALFCFGIDVSLQNAWQLYRISEAAQHRQLTLAQFRRDVAMTYIMKYRATNEIGYPIRCRAVSCRAIPDDVRFDGQNHFIGRIDGGQKRCSQCGMKVQKKCNKCLVALHDRCFELFHRK